MGSRILTEEQINAIIMNPIVLEAKDRLATSNTVSFTMDLPTEIKAVLQDSLGLDLPEQVPLRWIKGDTPSHADVARSAFERTHLVYLTDSEGTFNLGDESFPICKGESFVFPHGTLHGTSHTGTTPRLMLGPMSEAADPVGGFQLRYYPTQADALANTNQLGNLDDPGVGPFIVGQTTSGTTGGFTIWRIASNSTGSSNPLVPYPNGYEMTPDGYYYVYPEAVCFAAGSRILCDIGPVPVEDLKVGMKVKTLKHGYKAVTLLGKSKIHNPSGTERVRERLYRYPKENLVLTGGHSVLLDTVSGEQMAAIRESFGKIFFTEGKIRLMAKDDPEAELYPVQGTHEIYNFVLEAPTEHMNYGVFANGKLVESSFPYWIKKGMTLV
jgi:hypothetical protein